MHKTVFILGAGASKEAGAPLMADFLDTAYRLWRSSQVGDKEKHFENVFKVIGSLQQVHSKASLDLDNIESIFTTLEMAKVIKRLPGYNNEDIDQAIRSLKELIVKTLELTIKYPVQEGRYVRPPNPYEAFVDLLNYLKDEAFPRHEVALITFNYDLAIDYAMHMKAIGPNYRLGGVTSPGMPLLKLHGSLNWAYCGSCKKIVPWTFNEYFSKYHWPMLSHSKTVSLNISANFGSFTHCSSAVDQEPVLVPPSWNKTGYHSELTDVWSAAADELSKAENILIIGYSLPPTDMFFRHLYALGTVGDNPLKRFWVFNPDESESTKKRFENLLGTGAKSRFRYLPKIFSQAIPDIKKAFT